MKQQIIYICEKCNTQYDSCFDALKCEANCLGVTVSYYRKYRESLGYKSYNGIPSDLENVIKKKGNK